MAQKRMVQVDFDTGEVIEGYIAYVVPKRKNGFEQGKWMALNLNIGAMLAVSNEIDGNTYRVFFMLLGRLDYENLLIVNQAEIARELNMKKQNINRSIKRLVELRVIFEGPRIGVNRSYRLNPNFGWKGSAKAHLVALKDLNKAEKTEQEILEERGQQRLEV